jgi:hypothetical protein
MSVRSLISTIATTAIALTLALLAACATDTAKPAASTKPKPQFKVTVATNDAPLAPPWQMPAPVQQQPTAAQLPPNSIQNQNVTATSTSTSAPTPPPRVRILPLTARIASVNEKLRYVIVDFTNSRQPIPDERLGVYRVGEKVAEIKISGPYRNTTVAADIVAGEVKYGDEVKKE